LRTLFGPKFFVVFGIGLIQEDHLEFVKGEHAILGNVMLANHLLDLVPLNILAQLLHRVVNVVLRDKARPISIKLVENGHETLLRQESLHVDGG